MNALKFSLFDSVVPFAADFPAVETWTRRTGVMPLKDQPVSLWRASLAAHEPVRGVRWAARSGFALLGALSLASVGYALLVTVVSNDGLRVAVQSLMGH